MTPLKSIPAEDRTFFADFRRFFLRGLAILLPSVLTLWLFWAAYQFVQRNVAGPINAGIRQSVIQVAPRVLPPEQLPAWFAVREDQLRAAASERQRMGLRPMTDDALRKAVRARNFEEWWNDKWLLRQIGLVVAIILFYLAGVVLGGFIGRRVYARLEDWLTRLPLFRQVYPSIKQVVEFVFGDRKTMAFSRVVLVEYPRKGIWTLGLATGAGLKVAEEAAGEECVSVFIPSTPTPVTGFTITVPKREVVDVAMSIDEAVKFVVSGGVLQPSRITVATIEPGSGAGRGGSEAGGLAGRGETGMMSGPPAGGGEERNGPASGRAEPGGTDARQEPR